MSREDPHPDPLPDDGEKPVREETLTPTLLCSYGCQARVRSSVPFCWSSFWRAAEEARIMVLDHLLSVSTESITQCCLRSDAPREP